MSLPDEGQAVGLPGLSWVTEALEKKGFFTLQDLKQPESLSRGKALEMMRELAAQGYFTVSGRRPGNQISPYRAIPVRIWQ